MSSGLENLLNKAIAHLNVIYGDKEHSAFAEKLLGIMGVSDACATPEPHLNNWSQSDQYLITYGNSIVDGDAVPLQTLKSFLDDRLKSAISGVHVLPFFPYSSDDGFSVIDYLTVNPSLGDWSDITAISEDYKLMSDLVINHMSSRSLWFENFKKQIDPGRDFFIEMEDSPELDQVVRPRNSPLLTEYQTANGPKKVWCTFSADQVDLNFANPEVLAKFVEIIKNYLDLGISILRLDAVAFLWKEVGTPCVHLQPTHEIVKLIRTLVEAYKPDAIIITETNVPNRENLTYFGNANEAHVIYNFSLPPLLLHALLSGDCRHLKSWLMSMPPAQAGTAYLNFIASHDGIGLRPLDGLLSNEERDELVDVILQLGGKVTYRKSREGADKAYELNVALYTAMRGRYTHFDDGFQTDRFVCAHAIMYALEGIPATYIHSLLGTENDYGRLENTGSNRSINRSILERKEIDALLDDEASHQRAVFLKLTHLLNIRKHQPAFHPNATQFTLHLGTQIFAFWRQSINRNQSIFCLNNVTHETLTLTLADINLITTDDWVDLISGVQFADLSGELVLKPYQSVWLANQSVSA